MLQDLGEKEVPTTLSSAMYVVGDYPNGVIVKFVHLVAYLPRGAPDVNLPPKILPRMHAGRMLRERIVKR